MELTEPLDVPGFSEDAPYMNEDQLAYFKNKLLLKKVALLERASQKKSKLKLFGSAHADIVDKTNVLIELENDIKVQKINTEQIRQIEAALKRIEDGSFGYCELTGREIGLKRLDALPFTSLCVKAIEKFENNF